MKKILIVSANYYKNISKDLINSAKKKLNNHNFKVEIDAEASRHLFPSNERLKN